MSIADYSFTHRLVIVCLVGLLSMPLLVSAQDGSTVEPQKLETGSLGVTIGTPGGFNLNLTIVGKSKWGWTFSGGYVGDQTGSHFTGFQAGAVRKLGQSRHHYSGAHFFAGYIDIEASRDDVSAVFIGTGALIKWQVLYGEISFMAGTWDEEWPVIQMGGQIGIALLTFH